MYWNFKTTNNTHTTREETDMKITGALCIPALAGTLVSGVSLAQQDYPNKPVRMVIALAPGGGVDTTGRFLAQKMSEAWGQNVVADNRPGAGGSIAADLVAKAPPDGYTLLMTSSGISITPSIMKLGYDPRKDLLPVSLAVVSPGVMVVNPGLPVKSVKELIALAKSKPEELLYSSSGQGSGQHLAMEMFSQLAGIKMRHVPYKGTAPSITDTVAGRINLTIASVISTRPFFSNGRLRVLAVVGPDRTPALPKVPTVAESGVPGFGFDNWYGLFLPGTAGKAIAEKIQQVVTKAVKEPSANKLLIGQGLDPVGSTSDEFRKMYFDEMVRWSKVAASIGLRTK
jgi:tripartite-type tricarboxylate transporter receptor subunit TctC